MKEILLEKFGADLSSVNRVEFNEFIGQKAFSEAEKTLCGLEGERRQARSTELILGIVRELAELKALTPGSARAVLKAGKKALCVDDEQSLYRLLYEYDDMRKKIIARQKSMKSLITRGYETLEVAIANEDEEIRKVLKDSLQEEVLRELPLAEVLKEASELAFVSVLENGTDIEDTAHETAKNIAFYAINDGEFTQFRIKEISKIIINRAIFVANESKNIAPAMVRGAILGCYDGINKAAEKFLSELTYMPSETAQNLEDKKLQISQMSELFGAVLTSVIASAEEPAKSEIEKIASEEFGGYLAKFRKISSDLIKQLSEKIGEIEPGEGMKKASVKAREISLELGQKSAKILENLELDEKLDALKKEIGEFERKMSAKFNELKTAEVTKNMSEKAREMSNKAFEAAKDTIAKLKSKR